MGFTLIEEVKQFVTVSAKGRLWDRCCISIDTIDSEVWCLFSPLCHSLRVCFMIVEP